MRNFAELDVSYLYPGAQESAEASSFTNFRSGPSMSWATLQELDLQDRGTASKLLRESSLPGDATVSQDPSALAAAFRRLGVDSAVYAQNDADSDSWTLRYRDVV